ncbi:predicted protein [Plenodomus lingam JN3]|uniref:Predicted protein n=1 Tax=Leptosphaeria maculans (strain JN3 / isolate v23.1.3 / race Av1-4-5-6-7-8) TaxID=985895 RepID=E4ZJA9_LEPMJ|nr:predicted protein [Plenodomus lingam JN3]CBX91540.1 predicted protein [Plenodomus lingam JN3]
MLSHSFFTAAIAAAACINAAPAEYVKSILCASSLTKCSKASKNEASTSNGAGTQSAASISVVG